MSNLGKSYLGHLGLVIVALAIASIPAILASPVLQHFVSNHPSYALYFPLVSAALLAIYREYGPKSKQP